jgi:DNA-binding response OmpR family regulator
VAPHVLIVEDEEPVRQILVRNLRGRGYRVSEARTAAWAIASAEHDPPDVIVLDINLPDASGWDVLRGLAARRLPSPAVVAISAVPPARSRLAEFGPICFLPKPFLIEALLRAVGRAVTARHRDEDVDHPAV